MNHDELTARLRAAQHEMDEGWPAMILAANRLDRYRDIIRRCEWRLPCSAMRPDVEVLQRDIQEALR
jgi:hypothetical protein